MHPQIEIAVAEIKSAFPGHRVEVIDDGEGGAFVRVHDLKFGDQYAPNQGWITFRIAHTYPHGDVYPHHLPPGMKRTSENPLGEGFHQQEMNLGPFKCATTTISRRSNHWNPAQDTAALKLRKVLDWMTSLP